MTTSDLTSLDLLDRYATNRNDLVTEFYGPCLERSVAYDRAVGYFRSSVLLLAARPVALFAARRGTIRLICSPEMTAEDIDAIQKGYDWRTAIGDSLRRTIEQGISDPSAGPMVEFLATLIAVGCLDIRVAFRPSGAGIFHDKLGVFRDQYGHSLTFTGSSNETLNAWHAGGNHESFDVFRSWTTESNRVRLHTEYFERLWAGNEPGVETIPFPDVARDRLVAVSNPDGVEAAYGKVERLKRPPRKVPQKHQIDAIEAWERRGKRGILEHATGSGKTVTALTAMGAWLQLGRSVLVLVPSDLLVTQWHHEIQSELGHLDPMLLIAGAGHDEWRREDVVEGFTAPHDGPRIVLATLQTASRQQFHQRVRSSDRLFVVIDEVHRAGSPQFAQVFSIDAGARMGLSATPRRYGDPEGTSSILEYFDGIAHTFTLADAISAGRLCRYNYYVHPIHLAESEAEQWRELTKLIRRDVAKTQRTKTGEPILSRHAKLLLIRRADVLKNATSKLPLAVDVLTRHYQDGQRWLVYCDDQAQLRQVQSSLTTAGLPCSEYHSAMIGDKEAALRYFRLRGGVLVAIRCLDEGVDIPSADHALILASSRNPREFIQRRGRLLRLTEDKYFAHIHDALVLPPGDSEEQDDVAIIKGEIARAVHFADSAANDSVRFQIRQIARDAGIDPSGLLAVAGFEEDEEDSSE